MGKGVRGMGSCGAVARGGVRVRSPPMTQDSAIQNKDYPMAHLYIQPQ